MSVNTPPELSLYFLGAARLLRNGLPIRPDTRKAIALLAYLVVTGQPHSRDALAVLFYPENDESHARAALRRTLSALNKALGQGYIRLTGDLISIEPSESVWVDSIEFVRLIKQAQSCQHGAQPDSQPGPRESCPACLELMEKAVDLYQGDFLAGFSLRDSPGFDEWQFFKSEELRRLFASALEALARSTSLNTMHEKAIEYARRWVSLDPLVEEAHRELMKCYALAGQRNAALRQYQECARILEKELGVEPLEETQRLYQEIRHNRFSTPGVKAQTASEHPAPSQVLALDALTRVKFPLVGRSPETESLLRAYRQGAPAGYFFALQGEAGIGKTRLAEEFSAWARQQGAQVLSARCFEGEASLAYAPFIQLLSASLEDPSSETRLEGLEEEWLEQGARLLPALRANKETPAHNVTPSSQSLFYEGLRQVFLRLTSGHPPGILFVDDLHWADPASLDFLAYMVRRLPGNSLFILSAWRDEDLPTQARLQHILADAQRARYATGLRLSRLQPAAVADLTRQVAAYQGRLSDDFSNRLFAESEGLPYFLVEYLDALILSQGDSLKVETNLTVAQQNWNLPERVRDLLRLRIAQVDELARQLLAAAAIIGRSFDFETLVVASGRSEIETINSLETLLAHRLIKECAECESPAPLTYDFAHDKLRALVYEETSLTRRRLLHQRVAEALAERARHSRDPGLTASLIAHHYHLAGRDQEAAEYHRQAGEHARSLFAIQQALEHYSAALEAGHPDRLGLLEAVGDMHTLLGGYPSALERYHQAILIAVSLRDRARITQKIGAVHLRRGDYAKAVAHYQTAFQAIEASGISDSHNAALSARILADWSLAAYHLGEMENALNLAQKALERADEANTPRALAQTHNLLGVLARRRGQFATAQKHLEESLALAVRLQDDATQAAALNNLALLLSKDEKFNPQAINYAQEALALCERLGDRHRAAAIHNNLADFYHLAGQPELAIEHLKKAVALFTEIGGDATDMQVEVWKLTEW
jgi:predicted ATPase/DNA-binding SARP family transcriptional activator